MLVRAASPIRPQALTTRSTSTATFDHAPQAVEPVTHVLKPTCHPCPDARQARTRAAVRTFSISFKAAADAAARRRTARRGYGAGAPVPGQRGANRGKRTYKRAQG